MAAKNVQPTEHLGADGSWTVELVASAIGDEIARPFVLGVADSATTGFDPSVDLPLPPKSPGETILDGALRIEDPVFGRLHRDIRPFSQSIAWALILESTNGFRIDWSAEHLPLGEMLLVVEDGGPTINMQDQSRYETKQPGIWAGTIQYYESGTGVEAESVIGLSFALGPPQLGPGAGVVSIPYEIPRRSRTILKIFTPSGRLVRTLLDTYHGPGSYMAVWEGKTDAGRDVPSGVYLCLMQADGFNATRKILRLR